MNTKILVKKVQIAATAILISSCASTESYQNKMNRYAPKSLSKNLVPEITIEDFSFEDQKKMRAPASVDKKSSFNADEQNTTNKKLYFLALEDQYEKMKSYAFEYEAPTINSCPNFHSAFISLYQNESNKNVNQKFSYDMAMIEKPFYLAAHPELFLPLSKEDSYPKIVDIIKNNKNISPVEINEYVKKALDIHLAKTYRELKELCEYGVSDNYYVYENLITYVKNNDFRPSSKNMNILLKTTIFSNHALLTSLNKTAQTKGRGIASFNGATENYSYQIMNRLNVLWAKEYYNSIKKP